MTVPQLRFNAEQERAVATLTNVVVSAGAGSGKTSVLTTRFLVVLLRNPDWRMSHVVAITFTRAAAFEMKGRIRQRMLDLLLPKNEDLRKQFATWAGISLNHDEQRARWQDLLKQMDSARIDTIHALCADILRVNAPSADLDPRFAVLEEADARLLREQAYTHTLNALVDGDIARVLFKHYDESDVKKIATNANLLDALPDMPTYPTDDIRGYNVEIANGWDSLLRRVRDAYTALKQAQGALDFNDLEARTARLLRERDDVRARYRGADVRYVMVDEFQDTNQRQWEIVKSLVDLGDGQARVFIVGDRKQSIYAFRGADVSVFKTAEEDIGNIIVMNTSYRANQTLVTAINALFTQVFAQAAGGVPYEPLAHARADAPIVPPMRAHFYTVAKGEKVSVRAYEADAIARHLKEAVEGDAPLSIYDKEKNQMRPLAYSDVGLLLRTMTNASAYENAFDAHGIPYVTISKRGYYARQEVADILNALKALASPQDNLALASALRSPIFSLSDETLLRLRLHVPDATLMHALLTMPADGLPADQRERLHDARDVFRQLLPLVGRVTLAELLYALLTRTATLSKLQAQGDDGVRARLNVEKLLALADAKSHLTLGDYTRYTHTLLTKQSQEGEATQDEAQGVRLMSIHNSKGLEFPLVILPHFENRSQDSTYPEVSFGEGGLVYKGKKDVPKMGKKGQELKEKAYHAHYETRRGAIEAANVAELKRLLYVAITRAQDAVWIYGKQDSTFGFWKCVGGAKSHYFGLIDDTTLLALQEETLTAKLAPQPPAPNGLASTSSVPSAPALPLMAHVPPPRLSESLRHISATQLGHVSVAHYADAHDPQEGETRRISVTSLRQEVLGVAEDSGVDLHTPRVTRRIVGQMVHEAIRHRQFPIADTPIEDILASYGWRFNLTDEQDLQTAVQSAKQLLARFVKSEVYGWLAGAQKVLLELPFIYPTHRYLVHGQIDMLLQDAQGTWRIVDYKTSHVPKPPTQDVAPTLQQATQHARLYRMQLAAYAGAVRANFGAMGQDVRPRVFVHYIRYGHTVELPEAEWQGVLATFDGAIASALDGVEV